MKEFLTELEVLCHKHNVGLVWAVNAIRVVSLTEENVIPEKMSVLARFQTSVSNGKVKFRVMLAR